jgi:DNA-binding Xre family transcriptional regulator
MEKTMSAIKLGKAYTSVTELFEAELGPFSPEEERLYLKEVATQEIAEVLFGMRVTKNVTREALAAKTGMSVDDIIRLESDGEEVRFADVQRIAAALNYHISLKISGSPEPAECAASANNP